MQKLAVFGLISLMVLSGCEQRNLKMNDEQNNNEIVVASDAYYLSKQRFPTIKNIHGDTFPYSYRVNNEMELAEIAQYTIENGKDEFSYQCEVSLNLDKVIDILSRLNPYDLSLKQTIKTYTNDVLEEESEFNYLQIVNLDEKYMQNVQYAKEVVEKLQLQNESIEDKIITIHDFIIENCVYDDGDLAGEINKESFGAYGVFVNQKAVCTGYSRAFMMLAKEAGIQALFVVSERMNHSWNYVYDDSCWTYIDLTWNDALPKEKQRKYLKMKANEFKDDGQHEFDKGEEALLKMIRDNFFAR